MINSNTIAGKLRAGKQWIDSHPVRAATFAGWFQQGVTGLSAVLVIPICLKTLGADATGVWLTFQGFVMLAGLADFGVGLAVTRQAAHCLGGPKNQSLQNTDFLPFGSGWDGVRCLSLHAREVYRMTSLVAFVVGAATFDLAIRHTRVMDGVEGNNARLLWYLMLTVPCLLLLAARPVAIINGTGSMWLARLGAAVYFSIQAMGVAIAALTTNSLLVMALASLVATAIYFLSMHALCARHLSNHPSASTHPKIDRSLMVRFLRVAFPLGFVNVGAYLMGAVQVPMVGVLLGPASVAPFFLAQKIGQFLLQAALQFSAPKTVVFSMCIGEENWNGARKTMFHAMRYAVFTIVAAQLIFVFVVPLVAPVLLEGRPYPDTLTVSLLGIDYVVLGCTTLLAQFVLASGKNPFVITTLLAGAVNILAIMVVVPRYGLPGIPVASLLAGFLTNYGYAVYCWVRMNSRIKEKI